MRDGTKTSGGIPLRMWSLKGVCPVVRKVHWLWIWWCVAMPAFGQARIHDPFVRMLARPYGIEDRICLKSIDGAHFCRDGTARLVLTLENSGVKEVVLVDPVFQLDVADPRGNHTNLGSLSVSKITFPVTPDEEKVLRRYVVVFQPALEPAEVVRHLRSASRDGARLRLLGHAGMTVDRGGGKLFKRSSLKFELGGVTRLGPGFEPVFCRNPGQLPACGWKR